MKLGIISDTHDHISHIEKVKQLFTERNITSVIHLGDYCAGPSVRAMEGMNIIGISGNNDGDLPRIMGNFQKIGGDFRGEFCVLSFDSLSCACYHGTVPEIVDALITCKKYDVVFYGHTHKAHQEIRDGVFVLNPGSVHGFQENASVAIFDTNTKTAEIIVL